jgi:hypothetical protein
VIDHHHLGVDHPRQEDDGEVRRRPGQPHQHVAGGAVEVAEHVGLPRGDQRDLTAAHHRARQRLGVPAIAQIRHLDGQRLAGRVDQRQPVGEHRAGPRPVGLAAVDEEVDAARRIELVAARHPLAEPRHVLGAVELDHHVDPLVAVVVPDPHRAEDQRVVVDDEQLRVIEALAVVLDRDIPVAEDRLGQRVGPLLGRAGQPVDRAEQPGLELPHRIDALVEEALLVAAGVLVDRRDLVLLDRDLDAAVGRLEERVGEHVAGGVVAPQERADLHRRPRPGDPIEDRREGALPRAEDARVVRGADRDRRAVEIVGDLAGALRQRPRPRPRLRPRAAPARNQPGQHARPGTLSGYVAAGHEGPSVVTRRGAR